MEHPLPNTHQFTTTESTDQLQKIGAGHCGSVWAATSTSSSLVIKREDGGEGRSITHEYDMHRHVIQRLQSPRVATAITRTRISVPRCEGFLACDDETTWSQILPRLPQNYTSCNALISEKIPSMPRQVRKLLSERLNMGGNPDEIADDSSNTHCLVRPYLGRRKHRRTGAGESNRRRLGFYSLRNLPLHADQMESLDLDLQSYALAMADTLAFLHWSARVDANDVEFVLAQGRPHATLDAQATSSGSADFRSGALGSHSMWILDFDCCRRMSMDEAGVKQACKSFWRNDPYYPRPGSDNKNDQRLWDVFQGRFLETSGRLLEGEREAVRQLPQRLIELIGQTRGMFSKGTDIW
ncbi:hypothetical protein LX32DRAFT_693079 [Colletotrichum zoysiae]|uniref:DUF3669 domain-containing protein n=1 Tax=Colletotrichum zoysiae TaxID=1216348 RepID=A0AAD9HJU3_9PEZI|nr:hypothetical protein LX32DRAFT_693079 [Colletotrichum zoysiae]